MMIKTCIEANSLFDKDLAMGFIPVDFVSEAAVGLSLQKENLNKNFHLVNENSPTLIDIYKWVVNYGYKVNKYTYEEWYERMLKMAQRDSESTIKYMLTFLPNEVKEWDIDLSFDSAQAQKGLSKLSIECNKIDEKVFTKYLDFFIESGFLKKPLKEELV